MPEWLPGKQDRNPVVESLRPLPLAPAGVASVEALRQILDHFAVRTRLDEIRNAVWRGGQVRLVACTDPLCSDRLTDVAYQLLATWDTAVLEAETTAPGLVPTRGAVVDGRWVREPAGYRLRVGIDVVRLPNALYLRGQRLRVYVPFVGRSDAQIVHALDDALDRYANAFLDGFPPVPQAVAAADHLLRQRGL